MFTLVYKVIWGFAPGSRKFTLVYRVIWGGAPGSGKFSLVYRVIWVVLQDLESLHLCTE